MPFLISEIENGYNSRCWFISVPTTTTGGFQWENAFWEVRQIKEGIFVERRHKSMVGRGKGNVDKWTVGHSVASGGLESFGPHWLLPVQITSTQHLLTITTN